MTTCLPDYPSSPRSLNRHRCHRTLTRRALPLTVEARQAHNPESSPDTSYTTAPDQTPASDPIAKSKQELQSNPKQTQPNLATQGRRRICQRQLAALAG
jgi:hypothetical protein